MRKMHRTLYSGLQEILNCTTSETDVVEVIAAK